MSAFAADPPSRLSARSRSPWWPHLGDAASRGCSQSPGPPGINYFFGSASNLDTIHTQPYTQPTTQLCAARPTGLPLAAPSRSCSPVKLIFHLAPPSCRVPLLQTRSLHPRHRSPPCLRIRSFFGIPRLRAARPRLSFGSMIPRRMRFCGDVDM